MQHGRQPPRRMARDVRLYGHILRFQVEKVSPTSRQTKTEQHYTKIFKASRPTGPWEVQMFW